MANSGLLGQATWFSLETAVERAKRVQELDLHGETKDAAITCLVIRRFFVRPGESMACAKFVRPTAVSRFNTCWRNRRGWRANFQLHDKGG